MTSTITDREGEGKKERAWTGQSHRWLGSRTQASIAVCGPLGRAAFPMSNVRGVGLLIALPEISKVTARVLEGGDRTEGSKGREYGRA